MDNEIVELHPPLVTFASVEYDGDPPPAPNQIPPPPAPYDHKHNLVVVNKNDLESILVKGATNTATAFPPAAKKQYISNTVSGLELNTKPNKNTDTHSLAYTKKRPLRRHYVRFSQFY